MTCLRPGPTNTVANCKSDGFPAVEPTVAANRNLVVAAAADYNSYNGQPQFGFYWSRDGRRWSDAGPLDIFPHGETNAGGDPLIAIDERGVVYYAGMFFSYTECEVGGVELLRRDPATGRWSRTELAKNGKDVLQDRPGLAVEGNTIFYAWAVFDSCEGNAVESPLKVALVPAGPRPTAPRRVLDVPGTRYSQGAAPAGDGRGGFWLAWEEYPDAVANSGSIRIAHWSPKQGWNEPKTISPPGFRDLPEPLPGFDVDTSSVPAIAISNGVPHVVWASADSGRGRIYLWTPTGRARHPRHRRRPVAARHCARPRRRSRRVLQPGRRAHRADGSPALASRPRSRDLDRALVPARGAFFRRTLPRLGLRPRLLSRPDDRSLAGHAARAESGHRVRHVWMTLLGELTSYAARNARR